MISASHNPPEDNGIKFFSRDGFKPADEEEARIESLVLDGGEVGTIVDDGLSRPVGDRVGQVLAADAATDSTRPF